MIPVEASVVVVVSVFVVVVVVLNGPTVDVSETELCVISTVLVGSSRTVDVVSGPRLTVTVVVVVTWMVKTSVAVGRVEVPLSVATFPVVVMGS